ncbi:MAG: T9SS type A sorting domain-containing protein [Chitinophagaceae bacterium]|nr:T9SS type A sorting domain-containing protein [Chitinophagaceae bacterium]
MKKMLLLLLLTPIFSRAQIICNANGDLVLFTNYDGGTLNIDVDVNIPNLKIGIVTYEAVQVNLSGAYVNNVVAVNYAGYNSNNNNCSPSVTTTSINGAPTGATTSILFAPTSPLSNTNGYGSIICGYSCSTTTSQGGCNTIDQIEAYFAGVFPGSILRSHLVQYNCWSGTQTISNGGTCCASPTLPLTVSISASQPVCHNDCNASATATAGGGQSPYSYQWISGPGNALYNNLCPGTYTVVVTDAASNTITQSVTITNPAAITNSISQSACDTFWFNGSKLNASGVYYDTLQSIAGCDSLLTLNLTINSVFVGINQNGNTLTALATGANYQWYNCSTNTTIPGAISQTYTATQSGDYAVIVTQNGCTDTSICKSVVVSGMNETIDDANVSIYPNPFNQILTVKIPRGLLNRKLSVYDATGRVAASFTLNKTENLLDLRGLANGIYMVEIQGLKTRYKIYH